MYAALVLPSLFIVQKTIGTWGVIAYAAAAALVVAILRRLPYPRTRRQEQAIAVVLLLVLVVAFAVVFPRVNVHVPLRGSDDDDALDAGVRALLAGHTPYDQRTYLGNVLHQLPGAFVLAAPFVLAGTSALQSLFWLPLFFAAVRAEYRDGRWAPIAMAAMVASPVVMHQVVTGTSHVANTIYVLLGLYWLARTRSVDAAAICWGVALASRANFLLLVPLAFAWLRQQHGTTTALRATALIVAAAAALTLPFYVADPTGFGPLEAADRVTRFDAVFPYAGFAMVCGMGLVSVGLACREMTLERLFGACAIVQALPVAVGTLLGLVKWHTPDLAYLSYWTFASWFSIMAWVEADRLATRA